MSDSTDRNDRTDSQHQIQPLCPCISSSRACLEPTPLPVGFVPVESVSSARATNAATWDESESEFQARVADAASTKWDDCAGYERCLQYASCMGWAQFSCKSCSAYVTTPVQERFRMPIHTHAHWDFEQEVVDE